MKTRISLKYFVSYCRFYIQSKIHKEGYPGRPVSSSVNCHTSNISKYVDYHLQSIVQKIRSYMQLRSDFLRKINKIEKNTR